MNATRLRATLKRHLKHPGYVLMALGVSPRRAYILEREMYFWLSVAVSMVREVWAVVRSIPGAYRLAASELLHAESTPLDRGIFHLAFLLSQARAFPEGIALVWRNARAHRAGWLQDRNLYDPTNP